MLFYNQSHYNTIQNYNDLLIAIFDKLYNKEDHLISFFIHTSLCIQFKYTILKTSRDTISIDKTMYSLNCHIGKIREIFLKQCKSSSDQNQLISGRVIPV